MMKFPINRCVFAAACLLLAGLTLSGCTAQVVGAPEPPASLQVVANDKNSVSLSWEAVDDAVSYRVYRRVSGSSDFKFVADTEAVHYTDLQPGPGSYDYQVTALGPHEESAGTIFLAAAVSVESDALSVPEITSVSRLDTATNVLFFSDENTNCEYEILRQDASGSWTTIGKTAGHIYYDIAASEDSSYRYKVLVAGADGEIAESAVAAENTNPKTVFGVPVLMYHEFVTEADLDSGVAFDEYAIYADEFEHDLQWLQENGYTTVTIRELIQYLNGQGEVPEKPVILTIDDGKLGVYKNAYPLLQKYDMKAVLNVIGLEIDAATEDPALRSENPAPYCTWQEVEEMSDSGYVEIGSHTYGMHVYKHGDRTGADCSADDTVLEFKKDAYEDLHELKIRFERYEIPVPTTLAYPYSVRSTTADTAWRMCGYQVLQGGNMASVRNSKINYFIQEAGLNDHSGLLRRVARMHGTPIEEYIG